MQLTPTTRKALEVAGTILFFALLGTLAFLILCL